jgi:hypothetical protein
VQIKNEPGKGTFRGPGGSKWDGSQVSIVRFVEIRLYDNIFRLIRTQANFNTNNFIFLFNNALRFPPYSDDYGVKLFVSGGNLVFSTKFGLTITWNGKHKVEVSLCDSYADYVCGLCGVADGNVFLL